VHLVFSLQEQHNLLELARS